jgi:superfamily I DNA and/or RNA helicase
MKRTERGRRSAKRITASADMLKKMRGLAALMRDWMGSVSSRRRSFEEFLAKTRQIVAGTCVGLGRASLGIASAGFDLVVIDEAARCTPSELTVPMQAGRWIVLVGDHYQLEPFHELPVVVETRRRLRIPSEEIVRSDFDRAFASPYGLAAGEKLQYQYRMLPSIGALVSDVFYAGRLQHRRTSADLPLGTFPDDLAGEVVWITTDALGAAAHQKERRRKSNDRSLYNPIEANIIVDVLRKLDSFPPFMGWIGTLSEEQQPIGIICTYAAQRELIRQKIQAVGISGALQRACKIDTVDSYQGKQNLIIILSLVRNNEDGRRENGEKTIVQGFMSRGNRINVALSRAMDKLIIVGASARWPADGPMASVAARFAKLVANAEGAQLVAASQGYVAKEETSRRKAEPRSKGARTKATK